MTRFSNMVLSLLFSLQKNRLLSALQRAFFSWTGAAVTFLIDATQGAGVPEYTHWFCRTNEGAIRPRKLKLINP
jgi:hypothetical protein